MKTRLAPIPALALLLLVVLVVVSGCKQGVLIDNYPLPTSYDFQMISNPTQGDSEWTVSLQASGDAKLAHWPQLEIGDQVFSSFSSGTNGYSQPPFSIEIDTLVAWRLTLEGDTLADSLSVPHSWVPYLVSANAIELSPESLSVIPDSGDGLWLDGSQPPVHPDLGTGPLSSIRFDVSVNGSSLGRFHPKSGHPIHLAEVTAGDTVDVICHLTFEGNQRDERHLMDKHFPYGLRLTFGFDAVNGPYRFVLVDGE